MWPKIYEYQREYNMTIISIITPFFHGNQYLGSLAEDILEAGKNLDDGIRLEWILVNDSPDEKIVAPKIASDHIRISEVSHDRNKGIHEARVTGLLSGHGSIVHFLDQDDRIRPDFYQKLLQGLSSQYAASVCNGWHENADGTKEKLFQCKSDLKKVNDIDYYLKVTNAIQSPGQCLIKKRSIPKSYIQNKLTHNGSDDLFLWIEMLAEGAHFKILPECLYLHKETGKNVSSSMNVLAKSSFEVENALRRAGHLKKGQLDALHRSILFSVLSKEEKRKQAWKNPDLMLKRLEYRLSATISPKI